MAPKVATKEAQWVEVTCAYCQGKGRDRFGIPSPLSSCPTCGGRGTVRVKEPYHTCQACNGSGVQPYKRLNCAACGGKGVQTVEKPWETCPVCGGVGRDNMMLYCTRCHGTGVITAKTADS